MEINEIEAIGKINRNKRIFFHNIDNIGKLLFMMRESDREHNLYYTARRKGVTAKEKDMSLDIL